MARNRRLLAALSLLAFLALAAGMPAASSSAGSAPVKPVIGTPVAAPAKPVAGKAFVLSFKVTRSDTKKPLTTGTITSEPSVGGKVIPHTQSLRGGIARVSFVVPADAGGKPLKVKVTIKVEKQSATKIFSFAVQQVPKASIGDVAAAEGSSGTTTLSVPVTLSAASAQPVSVSYATADGTATAPGDYASANGTLTFKPGETTKTVDVAVVADTAFEADETITVTISNPVNATIADGSATATIRNDDPKAHPGHYAGTTSQNELFALDVTPDGANVTGVTTGQINQSCNGGATLSGGSLNLSSTAAPVADDGSFTIDIHRPGIVRAGPVIAVSDGHIVIAGRFSGDTASGNLEVTTTFTLFGTNYSCSSGAQTWTASRTG